MKVNGVRIIPYIMESHKIHVPNHQPEIMAFNHHSTRELLGLRLGIVRLQEATGAKEVHRAAVAANLGENVGEMPGKCWGIEENMVTEP